MFIRRMDRTYENGADMSFVMQTQLAAIKMVDKERGDLFAVVLHDRNLIVQALESLPNADQTRSRPIPGVFAVTDGKPEELWLRVYNHGSFTQCRYWLFRAICPDCGYSLAERDEKFICAECKFTTP